MWFIKTLSVKALCCVFPLVFAETAQSSFQTKNLPSSTASQKQGAVGRARPVMLVSKLRCAQTPIVDDSHVYWINYKSSGVMKVSKNGGTPVMVVSGQDGISRIVVDETAVYFTTPTQVVKVDKNGGAPRILSLRDGSDTHLAVDETNVYFFSYDSEGLKNDLLKISKAGGMPVILTSGVRAPIGIITDETGIYWYDYADDMLSKIDNNVGAPSKLAWFMSGHNAIASDAESIYCGNVLGEVKRVSKSGGKPVVIISGQSEIKSMAIDQASIYFATEDRIKRFDKAGGAPVTLASGQDLDLIGIDAEAVYWVNYQNGTVMKIVK